MSSSRLRACTVQLFGSKPHFLNASEDVLNAVNIDPPVPALHDTYVDVEPVRVDALCEMASLCALVHDGFRVFLFHYCLFGVMRRSPAPR